MMISGEGGGRARRGWKKKWERKWEKLEWLWRRQARKWNIIELKMREKDESGGEKIDEG